jgi:transcriptional regulator of aromatic amino acid metabolism
MQTNMLKQLSVFDEISTFIAGMNPEKVINFTPSSTHQQRLDFLLDKQTETGLSADEKSEVEQYILLNRMIGLAKARAIRLLQV